MGDGTIKRDKDQYIADLVIKAQRGDDSAVSELIEKTQDRLYRFCYYLTQNPILAQDICQDVYVKVLEKIKKIKDPAAFQSWLFRVAKNIYLDHIKSPKNHHLQINEDFEISDGSQSLKKTNNNLELWAILDKLPADERLLIVLIELEGYSYMEAADIVGTSQDALRLRLHRIRKKIVDAANKLRNELRSSFV